MFISNRSARTLTTKFLIWSLLLGPLGISNTGMVLAANNKDRVTKTQTASAQTNTNGATGVTRAQTNTQPGARKAGQLIVSGSVTVNGNKAINGTTIFNDSYIEVASTTGNSAIANLGNLGRVELDSGAKIRLQYSDGLISGKLDQGKATANVPEGVKVAIAEPNHDIPSGSPDRGLEVFESTNNVNLEALNLDSQDNDAPQYPPQGSASGAQGSTAGATSGTGAASGRGSQSQLTGQLSSVNGTVSVNGSSATTGTSISNGSYIVVGQGAGNSAVADLGQLGSVEFPAGTKIKLQFRDGLISGNLDEGSAVAKVPNNVQVAINTQNKDLPQNATPRSVRVITMGNNANAPTPAIAPGGGGAPTTGNLIAHGAVTVNGARATSGMQIPSGSVISVDTSAGNNAIVDLGNSGQVELDAGAKIKLNFSDGSISGDLTAGRAIAIVPDGTEVAIDEPNNNLPAGSPVRCVQVVSMSNTVIAGQTGGQCCIPVPVSVQVPVSAPATVPATVPVIAPPAGGGIGALGIAGLAAGAAGIAVGGAALANSGGGSTPPPIVVSPVVP